jgi:hypothetical protein
VSFCISQRNENDISGFVNACFCLTNSEELCFPIVALRCQNMSYSFNSCLSASVNMTKAFVICYIGTIRLKYAYVIDGKQICILWRIVHYNENVVKFDETSEF